MVTEQQLETLDININMGPQHPSTHGVFRMVLAIDGERVVVACVVGGLVALFGAGLAVALVTRVVVEHLAVVVGAAGLVLLAWVGLSRVGVCAGIHCPGCRHHH